MLKLFEMLQLFCGLTNRQTAKVGPFYVTVDITRDCNLHCPGCRYHSRGVDIPTLGDDSVRHMPLPLFQDLCNQLHAAGTQSMTITGEGEPLLHPRLLDMIGFAKGKGLSVSVFTNGTLIDEDISQALIDLRLDVLKVSLWASSRKEYKKNYPGTNPAYFDRVKSSLHLIQRLKTLRKIRFPQVKLHQPIDRRNYRYVEAMLGIAKETGCEILSFSPFKTQNRMLSAFLLSPKETQQVCRHLRGMREIIGTLAMDHTIDSALARYEIGGAVWEKLPCYIGWLHARIKPDGNVLPCNHFQKPFGNLKRNGLEEIWNGQGFRCFREQTMTREGLKMVAMDSDCYFCCHVIENLRVHRKFRWAAPFLKRKN